MRDLGIEIRAGVHTGECEMIDGKIGGITVSIGARVAALAGAVRGPGLTDREGPRGGMRALLRGRRRARAEGRPRPLAPVPGRELIVKIPETRYATAPDGGYIAYQSWATGRSTSPRARSSANVDSSGNSSPLFVLVDELSSFSRLILHDRRGTGLSDDMGGLPDLETRVQDLRCVLDTIGSDAWCSGATSRACAPNVLFASTDPERVSSIVWWEPNARATRRATPWGAPDEYLDGPRSHPGGGARSTTHRLFFEAETEAHAEHDPDPAMRAFVAKISRHTGPTSGSRSTGCGVTPTCARYCRR